METQQVQALDADSSAPDVCGRQRERMGTHAAGARLGKEGEGSGTVSAVNSDLGET